MTEKFFSRDYNINLNESEKTFAKTEIEAMIESFVNEHFSDLKNEKPSLVLNNRLSSTNGSYNPNNNKITLSGKMIKAVLVSKNYEHLSKVLSHELCHWYLFKKKGNYRDGEEEFESLLKKVDSASSGATNKRLQFVPPLGQFGFYKVNKCKKCGYSIYLNTVVGKNKVHKDCGGHFEFDSIVLLMGEDD